MPRTDQTTTGDAAKAQIGLFVGAGSLTGDDVFSDSNNLAVRRNGCLLIPVRADSTDAVGR